MTFSSKLFDKCVKFSQMAVLSQEGNKPNSILRMTQEFHDVSVKDYGQIRHVFLVNGPERSKWLALSELKNAVLFD